MSVQYAVGGAILPTDILDSLSGNALINVAKCGLFQFLQISLQ